MSGIGEGQADLLTCRHVTYPMETAGRLVQGGGSPRLQPGAWGASPSPRKPYPTSPVSHWGGGPRVAPHTAPQGDLGPNFPNKTEARLYITLYHEPQI